MELRADWRAFLVGCKDWVDEFIGLRRLALIVGMFALAGGSWYAYRSHKHNIESTAQRSYTRLFALWQKAELSRDEGETLWKQLSTDAKLAMERHSSSTLHPFFTVLHAQAAMQASPDAAKAADVVKIVSRTIKNMDKANPFYAPMQLQAAKIMLDAGQRFALGDAYTDGESMLQSISRDLRNPYHEMAQAQLAYAKAYAQAAK
jgi:hypothetical protein